MESSQNYSLMHHPDCIPQRDTEADYVDWFEDAASEVDWIDNCDSSNGSSTGCSLAGSIRSGTLLDELYEKNNILEKQLRDAELRLQNLSVENQRLNVQLANERHRATKFQKKLQYIEDNQEIFNRLRQAYLNMKYNETTGRTMKEINESGSQTWESVMCEACLASNSSTALAKAEKDIIAIRKKEFAKLRSTVDAIKDKIEQREKSWSFNAERENKYKTTITQLQANVGVLQGMVAEKSDEIALVKSESDPEMVQKENDFLKNIIIKMEKRHRDMVKIYKAHNQKYPGFLNENEKFMIQQLIKKYSKKLKEGSANYPLLEAIRSLPTSPAESSKGRLPRRRPHSEGTNRRRIQSGIGDGECSYAVPPLELGTDISAQQAEKPFSPNKPASLIMDLIYQKSENLSI